MKFNNAKGGKIITNSLLKQINPPLSSMLLIHIEKKDNCFICDFYNHKKSNTIVRCVTQILIIASGGYGGNFLVNDNVSSITGECLILAKNIGAKLRGMSTVMLHPWGVNNGKNILVGEIVSLSQGKLVDKKGRQLLKDKLIIDAIKNNSYHEIFDILLKMEYDLFKSYSNIFLDFSSNDDEKTYKVLKYYGYSPSLLKDHKIIIQPTVHYTSGGIVVDEKSMAVNCENLYVVGEAQYNGNKGCGRLPGQAFTSAIICGKIIARNIKKESPYYITNNFNDLELPYLIHRFYSEKNISLEVIKEVDYELKKFFSEVILYKFDNHDLNKFDHKFYELKNFILHNLYGHGAILSKIISLFYRVDIIKEIYKDILYKSKK